MYEGSVRSDEEYDDDLAVEDIMENGYITEDEFNELNKNMGTNDLVLSAAGEERNKSGGGEKYQQNLDRFLRTKSEPFSETQMQAFASPVRNKNERRAGSFDSRRLRKRSQSSIPAFGKQGPQRTVSVGKEAL